MSQTRSRQITRLEKLAQSYIARKRQYEAERDEYRRRRSFVVIANLALLVLYGDPKIDEPLLAAWERCRESAAWQSCREKHGGFDDYGRETGTPFDSLGAMFISKYFGNYFLPDLPGADETEKLNVIFEMAPPWLLWFTYGDLCAHLLGVKLPDLSGFYRCARGEFLLDKLPDGPFVCHPLPRGVVDRLYISSRKAIALPDNLTRRERKRAVRIYGRTSELS
jgi:hypothetical protein